MAKNKMKSHRGAMKRFKLTGTGKVKRNKAYKSHILTKKTAKRKHKKILKLAKGFYGSKHKIFSAANPAVMRSLRSAQMGRKLKKREYRRLWIARINAAARANDISYSRLMNGLKKAGIEVNRKMLSEMAIHDPAGFTKMVESAKAAL